MVSGSKEHEINQEKTMIFSHRPIVTGNCQSTYIPHEFELLENGDVISVASYFGAGDSFGVRGGSSFFRHGAEDVQWRDIRE